MGLRERPAAARHELHQVIGSLMIRIRTHETEVLLDAACEQDQSKSLQRLPLFRTDAPRREAQYCNVDVLVIQNSRVRVIVEIEETGIKPVKICGKLLTSALSKYYIHETQSDESIPMAEEVLFVQALRLPLHGVTQCRLAQWVNLEKDIRGQLPIGAITHYELLAGSVHDFQGRVGEQLLKNVTDFLDDRTYTGQ